jgi:hypothetical protein
MKDLLNATWSLLRFIGRWAILFCALAIPFAACGGTEGGGGKPETS